MLRILSIVLLGLLWLASTPARAADSFDSCTGYIDSLPASISSQGVWCLRNHLSTGINSGSAITINTNNVTIDCNDFKLGGLGGGIGTKAYGIHAYDRQNITVRNCSIRGFWIGIDLSGYVAAGHVVRDNRLDNITSTAVSVWGPGSTARNNIVRDTGGSPDSSTVYGIFLWEGASAIDNTISGVYAAAGGNGNATGMHCNSHFDADGYASSIVGNRIQNLVPAGTGTARGIAIGGDGGQIVRDNHLSGIGIGTGINCAYNNVDTVWGNVIHGFATGISVYCGDEGNIVR